MLCQKIAGWMANSVDSDETPCSAASHLGLYCLLRPVCPNTCGKYGNYKLSGYCPVTATFQMLEYRSDWPFTAVFLDTSGYLYLTLCMLDNFARFFCHLRIFLTFQKKKKISGIPLECQTVWLQIWPDILSGLIWVQIVCKGFQQMTNAPNSGKKS